MIQQLRALHISTFLFTCFFCNAQADIFSKNYFRNPLDIPLQLAANFGELRTNHFHMGLDIRTQGRENFRVYAAAEGYISRIKIEEQGFGQAIYITHPNGLTTVYAHLNKFYAELEKFIKQKQYAEKKWQQDIFFPPQNFPVSKGQFIALSGNTGASAGPHLHFEIRNTATDENVNPLLFNFPIIDNLAPEVQELFWYDMRFSTYQNNASKIFLKVKGNNYFAAANPVQVQSPLIGFAVRAKDKINNSSFTYGIYSESLWLDDSLVFNFSMDSISYHDTRYINACMDFAKWNLQSSSPQYLFKTPGNFLPLYNKGGSGALLLPDTFSHRIKIQVRDIFKNETSIYCNVQFNGNYAAMKNFKSNAKILLPLQENKINEKNIKLSFSKTALYDALPFTLNEQRSILPNNASSSFTIGAIDYPVHDSFLISIKTNLPNDVLLRSKVIMFLQNGKNKTIIKGKWQQDWLQAKCNKFGTVQLLIDNEAPAIQPIGWKNGQKFTAAAHTLKLLCKDNLSDIKNFSAVLDEQWLLFTKKENVFTYYFDEYCTKGKHTLKVVATDIAGNSTEKIFSFIKE